jgi:hypothetical protein
MHFFLMNACLTTAVALAGRSAALQRVTPGLLLAALLAAVAVVLRFTS